MLHAPSAAKLLAMNLKESAHLWGGLHLLLTSRMGGTKHFEKEWSLGRRITMAHRRLVLAQRLSGDRQRYGVQERELMDEALEHLRKRVDPEPDCRPVAEVSPDIDPTEFRERFVKHPQPVIIRGLARRDCAAIGKWNREHFVEHYGDTQLELNRIEYGQPIKVTEWQGQLREALESSNIYLDDSKILFSRFPELTRDIAGVPGWGRLLGKSMYVMPQLFLGDTLGAPFHCANHWNFFVMAKGRKQWTFISPEHTLQVGTLFTPSGIFADGCATGKGDTWRDNCELFTHYCPKYRGILEEGDVLLNPPWWWHEIKNLTPFPIGMATRWVVMNYARTNTLFDLIQLISPEVWKMYYQGMMSASLGEDDVEKVDALKDSLETRNTDELYRVNYGVRAEDPGVIQAAA